MKIKVKVIANSKKAEIIQEKNFLKIKVDAPAEKGKANKRLIEILSDYLKVSKNKVRITRGIKSREKSVEIMKVE